MKRRGYIAWVNNDPFWHPSLASAQRRVNVARLRGKDTFLYRLQLPYAVTPTVTGKERRFGSFKNKTEARDFYDKAKQEQKQDRFFPERYQHGGYDRPRPPHRHLEGQEPMG